MLQALTPLCIPSRCHSICPLLSLYPMLCPRCISRYLHARSVARCAEFLIRPHRSTLLTGTLRIRAAFVVVVARNALYAVESRSTNTSRNRMHTPLIPMTCSSLVIHAARGEPTVAYNDVSRLLMLVRPGLLFDTSLSRSICSLLLVPGLHYCPACDRHVSAADCVAANGTVYVTITDKESFQYGYAH